MDDTMRMFLDFVKENPGKSGKVERLLKTEISMLRLYAWKNRGTGAARWCNREANFIENKLNDAKGK